VPEPVPIDAGVELPDSSLSVPVRSDDDLLGVLTIDKPRGTPVTPQDVRLVEDLATQAGLVLRNVRLVEELKASRQRLVTAQTEERRRLERDLHDGAQQRLVTMALSLRLARDRAAAHGDPALAEQIGGAEGELAKSLAELRELARGIHPAVLTNSGLAAALASFADRSSVPTDVRIVPEVRFPPDVEAAAYFVVSEALANAAKHAGASAATVSVSRVGTRLVVEVSDDGIGGASLRGTGLRGLTDRVAALGGHLRIESPRGHGTKVIAEIPCV
jgi:signal transduction histidine kinase